MNITITGNLGSGKTSVCRELKKMGFDIISAGDIFRELAAEKGMTVIELNEAAKSDRSIDDMLDKRSTELGHTMDRTVFDSRLAWHFVEHSFKVFLLVDVQEAAVRVSAGSSRNAENYQNEEEARLGLETRAKLEQERFAKLYGIDYYDAGNYDLVIESSMASPQQLAQEIIRNFEQYQKEPFATKVELNLQGLYPGRSFQEMDADKINRLSKKEREQNHTLCAMGRADIIIKNGYNYIQKGHHQVFAAIAAGRVFAEIGKILYADGTEADIMMQAQDVEAFEQAADFQYRIHPAVVKEKPGYSVKFPDLE